MITADIPLAARCCWRRAGGAEPARERYSEATIRERLTMRDFMETLRASGVQTGGQIVYRSAIGNSLPPSWRSGCWRLSRRRLKPSYRHRCQNHRRQSRCRSRRSSIVGKELIVSWRNGSSPAVVSCAMLSCAEAASGCGFFDDIDYLCGASR